VRALTVHVYYKKGLRITERSITSGVVVHEACSELNLVNFLFVIADKFSFVRRYRLRRRCQVIVLFSAVDGDMAVADDRDRPSYFGRIRSNTL